MYKNETKKDFLDKCDIDIWQGQRQHLYCLKDRGKKCQEEVSELSCETPWGA